VIDPAALIAEIKDLRARSIRVKDNLFISERAHLIMPYHRLLEKVIEQDKGSRRIGTTGKGVGISYVDKAARIGLRVGDLLEPELFRDLLSACVDEANFLLRKRYRVKAFSLEKIYSDYMRYGAILSPYITDTSFMINRALDARKNVLFEGAQGTHLDVDHGTYPYVTSSNASAGGACTGSGVGPTRIDSVIGIVKAYTTRVGSGPFPTELDNPTGELLRKRGREYGATTGRPRRCGWIDMLVVRYAARINGIRTIAVTKLDILDRIKVIKICVGYRYLGKTLSEIPSQRMAMEYAEPIYEEQEGWMTPTTGITAFVKLPGPAKKYLRRIEKLTGTRITMISTGSRRDQTIFPHGRDSAFDPSINKDE
jgi:adenylosuccinate synthase